MVWNCPTCGQVGNTGNYCGECGTKRPELVPTPSPEPTPTPEPSRQLRFVERTIIYERRLIKCQYMIIL